MAKDITRHPLFEVERLAGPPVRLSHPHFEGYSHKMPSRPRDILQSRWP